METNPDILNLFVADRQRRIREGIADANRHHPLAFARKLTGQSLIAIRERIRGASRAERSDEFAEQTPATSDVHVLLRHAR